ncbi:MAG: hypothetical protein IKB34_09280 [Clostridia bacterium]|nr:hypothetical protein [Clostridia bacterium]
MGKRYHGSARVIFYVFSGLDLAWLAVYAVFLIKDYIAHQDRIVDDIFGNTGLLGFGLLTFILFLYALPFLISQGLIISGVEFLNGRKISGSAQRACFFVSLGTAVLVFVGYICYLVVEIILTFVWFYIDPYIFDDLYGMAFPVLLVSWILNVFGKHLAHRKNKAADNCD